MTIVWSPRAVGHLVALRQHIADTNPAAATRIGGLIVEGVERLARFPGLGRPGRIAGTRELVVPGTRYLVPYRVRGSRVEVIAVFHERQRWPKQL